MSAPESDEPADRLATPTGESRLALVRRARRINRILAETYPDAACELDFSTPLELLVATILSAQCTDKRVNLVTPELFARYPGAADYAAADPEELQDLIRSTGFYRNKATSIQGMARALCEDHGGEVPRRMAQLVLLPGVGRKTANVVLGNAFDTPASPSIPMSGAWRAVSAGPSRPTRSPPSTRSGRCSRDGNGPCCRIG